MSNMEKNDSTDNIYVHFSCWYEAAFPSVNLCFHDQTPFFIVFVVCNNSHSEIYIIIIYSH